MIRSIRTATFALPRFLHPLWLAFALGACSGADGGGGADAKGGSSNSSSGGMGSSSGGMSNGNGGSTSSNTGGGSSTSGGSASTNGGSTNSNGGGTAKGGASSNTGGSSNTNGGSNASGGASTNGGSSAAGNAGKTGSGGTSAQGGSNSNGGASSTGGSSASGGNGGAGGTGGASPWPQCYATDKMPADNAALKQRAPASDYKTQIAFGGVAMLIGPNRQSCITDAVANFDVKDLNGEIKDIVEGLGFPGFGDWKNGYYLNWVILNSGIPGATLSGQGGHQGDRWGHMNFESTEECPCNWGTGNNSNRGNALHEATHALQAELWAFNNPASGWIHEAHNCYLGTLRTHIVYNEYTMGYGAAASLQMPHIPLESMGVLTDDTVAGPADQLASGKTYVNSIVRYGHEIFFLSLSLEMGRGFINCMWIDGAKTGDAARRVSSRKSVFQVLNGYAGAEGVAHAILSFGARSSLLDFGGWTAVVRSTLQGNWNNNYWFYTFPGGDGTTTFSPPTKQIPHHQGRNIIPIKLASGATSVTVEFTPDAAGSKGTKNNMRAQLTYRTTDDKPVYGAEFTSGQNTIMVPNGARNGIVNLVIAVTNANADSGGDDGSNKGFDGQEHFNYKARIVSGGTIAPTTTRPW
ncbi:MAG: hypothetical protein ACOY0T_27750 [Myxococcota bacterium]